MKPCVVSRRGLGWSRNVRCGQLLVATFAVMLSSPMLRAQEAPANPLVDFFLTLTGNGTESTASAIISNEPATHRQQREITIKGRDGKGWLQSFCVDSTGRLIAVVGANNPYGAGVIASKPSNREVQIFDAEGKEVAHWTLDFDPHRVAVSPNDEIYVAGDGRIARFDAKGKKLDEQDAPHIATLLKDPETMRKNAIAERESRITLYKESMNNIVKQRAAVQTRIEKLEAQIREEKEAEEKAKAEKSKSESGKSKDDNDGKCGDDDKPAASEAKPAIRATPALRLIRPATTATTIAAGRLATQLTSLKQQLKSNELLVAQYERMVGDLEKRTPEDFISEITQRLKKINAITVTEKDVFITTGIAKGYGFAVWRATRDLKEGKEIITGLSGCCGQMDVQARGNELFVAENTRHRVGRYDRDGKTLSTFGKNEREGAGGCFGGCCNPMNVCFGVNGVVLTAESEGKVKAFQADGTYLGLVGLAKVAGGCKNVTIASTADGDRVYFYDLQASRVVVLVRDESPAADKKPAKTAMKD